MVDTKQAGLLQILDGRRNGIDNPSRTKSTALSKVFFWRGTFELCSFLSDVKDHKTLQSKSAAQCSEQKRCTTTAPSAEPHQDLQCLSTIHVCISRTV
jgi:hypothetical protein